MAESSLDEQLTKRESEGGSYARHVENLRAELNQARASLAKHIARADRKAGAGANTARTHLVIGDSHAEPGVPNDRYRWLGKLCADRRPEVIVDIGDWADMPSLSSYDAGKKSFEGRRYWKDVAAAKNARENFGREIARVRYKPLLVHTEGNHENRIDRATDDQPALDGLISTKDLGAEEHGWEVHKFLVPVTIDGITYVHYAPSGVKSRPIGGMHHASSIIRLCLTSTVVGHSHVRDYAERTRLDGGKVFALSAPCYFEQFHAWAGPANAMYTRGLTLIHNVSDGYGSIENIDMATIRKRYG